MILYLDASALVKRYVSEAGSAEVNALIMQTGAAAGTASISRAEVAAAIAKGVRMKALSKDDASSVLQAFSSEWETFIRLQLTETLITRAAALAWEQGLRGYDAVHLASAVFWQEMMGEPVTLATYDRQLWEAAARNKLAAWPARREDL